MWVSLYNIGEYQIYEEVDVWQAIQHVVRSHFFLPVCLKTDILPGPFVVRVVMSPYACL